MFAEEPAAKMKLKTTLTPRRMSEAIKARPRQPVRCWFINRGTWRRRRAAARWMSPAYWDRVISRA
jgi:hypothetical protein